MKSIFSLMLVDLKLITKNIFFWVLLGTLIAIIFVVNFLLPQSIGIVSPTIVTYGFEADGYRHVEDKGQLKKLVEQDKNIIGVALNDGDYTVLSNGLNNKQVVAAILPLLDQTTTTTHFQLSQTLGTITPPPFNKHCLPVFICFEAVVQGFLLAGVLMLNEKSERIVRAIQISPIKAYHYWIAKILLFSVVGSLYALLMALFTIGFSFPVIPYVLVSIIASALFTMIGIITATFFRSINNWFMLASLVLGINMLTMFAYIFPSLSLPFMKLIPSYPFIFLYEQILFGEITFTLDNVTMAAWFTVLCAVSIVCIKRKFLRPQKGV